MENSLNSLKKIIINYIKICQLQKIIKFINVLKTLKSSVLCSNGIIYYKKLKIHFYEFTSTFKYFQNHLILDENFKFYM